MLRKCKLRGVRYIFVITSFLGFCVLYATRVNINVAIVAMVNNTAVYSSDNTTVSDECKVTPPPFPINNTIFDLPKEGEFEWSPSLQAVVLGAFYYGYCVSQIPGGRLAEMYSGKWVFGIGTLLTAVLTLLTPIAARFNIWMLVGVRALEGLAQGVTMPAMHSMLGRWLPESEKASLSTLVYVGINVGTVLSMPISGLLCNSQLFGGWPSAFYVIGFIGCFWFILWCVFVTDTPHENTFITERELKYITANQKIDAKSELPPIPWLKIFKSVPFWALIITQIGNDWAFFTLVNDLPTFFATMLHFEVAKNGFLSSFPHLLQSVLGVIVAFTTDYLAQKGCFSINFLRKLCNSVAGFGAALFLVGVCLSGCNVTLNVTFFTLSLVIGGLVYSGYMLNHLDLSPEYAGTLMGIANTISNSTGFLAPLVIGALTEEHQTLNQWRIAFGINVILLTVTTSIFLIFASTKKQDWADGPDSEHRSLIDSNEFSVNDGRNYKSIGP